MVLVKEILTEGEVDIDDQNNEGKETALIMAVKGKHWQVAQYLVEQGADTTYIGKENGRVVINSIGETSTPANIRNLLIGNCFFDTTRLNNTLVNTALNYESRLGQGAIWKEFFHLVRYSPIKNWWQSQNLVQQYRMYLENIEKVSIEHEEKVKAEMGSPLSMLSIRLYVYMDLYARIAKGLEPAIPKITWRGRSGSAAILSILTEEVSLIADIWLGWQLRTPFEKVMNNSLMSEQSLLECRAESVIAKAKKLPVGREYLIETGYVNHQMYVGLCKVAEDCLLARWIIDI